MKHIFLILLYIGGFDIFILLYYGWQLKGLIKKQMSSQKHNRAGGRSDSNDSEGPAWLCGTTRKQLSL